MTLVIYDGDCRFCRAGIDLVRRVDVHHRLAFCPFGHAPAERYLEALEPHERYASFHVVHGGVLYSAVDAARIVLQQLPGGRVAATLGLHHGYRLLARYRGVLGRFVPSIAPIVECDDRPLVTSS